MYDVLSEFVGKYKKAIVAISICVACVFAAFYAGYLCGIRNAGIETRKNEDHNTDRIEHVTNEIERGITEQREITERLDGLANQTESIAGRINKSEAGIGSSAGRITDVESRISVAEREIGKSRAAIEDCQRIIESVRNRSQTGTLAH